MICGILEKIRRYKMGTQHRFQLYGEIEAGSLKEAHETIDKLCKVEGVGVKGYNIEIIDEKKVI